MAKPPLISIALDIPDVRVRQTELTKDGERILTVASTITSTPCRRCGRTLTESHGVDAPACCAIYPSSGGSSISVLSDN